MSDIKALADRLRTRGQAALDLSKAVGGSDLYDDRGADDLRAAAILERVDEAVCEIRAHHYQDPKYPLVCVVCGSADGSWPCAAREEADALGDFEEARDL